MKNLVRLYSASLVFALVTSLAACTATSTSIPSISASPASGTIIPPLQAQQPDGDVTEAVASDAKSFQVYLTTDNTSRDFQFKVFASGLWQRDPKTNLPIPYMAESWTQSDDGKTYTFHLRKDMKWSDGVPITAQDFVWTFQQASNPDNKYPYISVLSGIASYTALDDYTVVIALKDASCTGILTAGQITPLPKHVWESLPWDDPEKNPEILAPSVVSGPWKVKEWKRDQYATFVPNELYFGGAPKLTSYTVRVVPDSSIDFQMLRSGEVDLAPVSPADYAEGVRASNLTLYAWDPAQPTWYFMGFNFRQPMLQDVQLRHALSFAMPRQQIADRIFNGLAKPAYTTYSPTSWVYNPDVPKYEYSTDTAKQLLDESGYKLDPSGVRLAKDGTPLKLRIYYPSTDTQRAQIAQIAQEEFSKLGIDVEITGMESKALFDFLAAKPKDWDIWVGLARDTSDPHFMYQAWSESTIPQVNTGAYVNKLVEDLYSKGNTPSCDVARRRGIYQQIQQLISADSPYIFLVYNTAYAFVNKRVVVNPPSILGINYQLTGWYVQK